MIKNKNKKVILKLKKTKKIRNAEKNYHKLLEEIKPFIKKRERKEYSTTGKWKVFDYEL